MVVNFSNIDFNERPILILKNASDTPLGVLGYAKNVSVDLKYNETSSIEFEVPEFVDGEATPFYNDIAGMRTVELQGVGQFTLVSPSESGDGVQKTKKCKGYSLEYEFVYKKITLPENTYKFWDETTPENSLLGMIMELMPSWSVGSVPLALQNKYRTFEVSNENLYNLIKGTVQKSYNCIFDFDTMTRKIYVRDAADAPVSTPVFLSLDNLAKEIELTENTEDIFTRLDVNGAEGVTIRDVNPTGTNKIINLDYYMTEDNFSSALIAKYNAWKQLQEANKQTYYTRSVQYAIKTAQKITEMAKLTDLRGEMTSLENLQAVVIEGIAQGLKTQTDLDNANTDIAAKQTEIDAKQTQIDNLTTELATIYNELKAITQTCSFERYFTAEEYKLLDRYIKDGELSESSFVVSEVSSYGNVGNGKDVGTIQVSFNGCTVTEIESAGGSEIYDIRGGEIEIESELKASVISAVIDKQTDGSFVATAYLSSGTIAGNSFPSACVSLTGNTTTINAGENSLAIALKNGYRYFTLDASEYEKRSVAWELYEYGEETLNKLSVPSYTFNVTSANFLALDEFTAFKNALALGEKVYVDMGERGVLQPITIGVRFTYDNPESMELLFSDSYAADDSTFRLVDLLEQSISMGKNLETSKYVYSSFMDSGASAGLREFMNSALDVARNAIMSSTDQAISWDGAGFRLRKWKNEAHTAYAPEQIWMNNNSIVMTKDGWATAEMAIGKFHDENLGDCWGIVAPRIVGTLLAGSSLVIESAKKDGGTAVFRVDGSGCYLYNSDISVCGDQTHIVLNPEVGFAIGAYPVYNVDEETGAKTLNEENVRFWADTDGNLNLTGHVTATSLTIKDGNSFKSADQYIEGKIAPVRTIANDAKDFANRIYNGEKGIYFTSSNVASVAINSTVGLKIVGKDNTYFQVMNTAMGFFKEDGTPMLYYENGNLTLTGIIAATGGYIGGEGGWIIGSNCMYNGSANTLGKAGGIHLGTTGISVGSAIVMKPDGSFIIRGDGTSTDASNYVLKIAPSTTEEGDTVYSLYLGNIVFADGFIVPPENGGTGGSDSNSVGSAIGLYRAGTTAEMQAIPDTVNGALCVLFAEGMVGTSISGALQYSTTTSPGYLAIGTYSASGHRNTNYFDITGISYWNISNLSGETVSGSYARVGVGETPSGACGLYMPLKITGSTGVTSITLTFNYALRPANSTRDLCYSWENPINIALYKGNSSVKVASTAYSIPTSWRTASSAVRTASITLNSVTGIASGEYYIAFYTRNTHSLMWIQHASISVEGKQFTSADGLYMKSGGIWKAIASSGAYDKEYVLPIASASALGGVMIGGNITINAAGKISLTKDNVVAALGYTPAQNSGTSVSITNLLTEGTRIATITVNNTAYNLYAPTSAGGGTVTGDFVARSGDTMTGNLTIQSSHYPSVILLPTNNNVAYRSVLEGSYLGESSIGAWNDYTGSDRRLIAVRNSAFASSRDDAIMLREFVGGSGADYRVFHAGMSAAGKKAALTSLGIYYAASLPSSGNDGEICLIPV